MTSVGVPIFGLFVITIFLVTLAPYVMGVYALIAIATTPQERFGPWWDNTRATWLIGVAVSFVIPLGGAVTAIVWITTGRRGLHTHGVAGRPFWAGAPKPPPYWPGPPMSG